MNEPSYIADSMSRHEEALLIELESRTAIYNDRIIPSLWLHGHIQWALVWWSCLREWSAALQPSGRGRCSRGQAPALESLSGTQSRWRTAPEKTHLLSHHLLIQVHPDSELSHMAHRQTPEPQDQQNPSADAALLHFTYGCSIVTHSLCTRFILCICGSKCLKATTLVTVFSWVRQSAFGCDPSHPYLFWLSCVSSQSSLNCQLAVVPSHLRGQGPQLIWTGHWFGHLKHAAWLSWKKHAHMFTSLHCSALHWDACYDQETADIQIPPSAVTRKPQAARFWSDTSTTLKVVPPDTIIYSPTVWTICFDSLPFPEQWQQSP